MRTFPCALSRSYSSARDGHSIAYRSVPFRLGLVSGVGHTVLPLCYVHPPLSVDAGRTRTVLFFPSALDSCERSSNIAGKVGVGVLLHHDLVFAGYCFP